MVACVANCIKNASLVKIFCDFLRFLYYLLYFNRILFLFMITILAITDGFKHFGEAINEYGKRLGKTVLLKSIKPISHTNPEYIKVKETLALIETLKKMKGKIVLLDERGKSMTTRVFADMLEDAKNESDDLILIIGGSYGIDLEIFRDIRHETLKISDFVVPHSLALLILLEQIYRAEQIAKGSGYHHE